MHGYGTDFYGLLASFAKRSARRVVPLLCSTLPIRNVVDFGCGEGAWLSVWREAGAAVLGIDGPYVARNRLQISASEFLAADLAAPIDLGRRFDLVQSLEVAEHLPAAKAEQFIDTLAAHGSRILFSAAVPGQGGEHHVNEQPLDYWRALFHDRGYAAFDYLRPLLCDDRTVQRWYRYNIMLYVKAAEIGDLPAAVRACRVSDGQSLAEYRPLSCRLRDAVIRQLPISAVDRLSRLKAGFVARAG